MNRFEQSHPSILQNSLYALPFLVFAGTLLLVMLGLGDLKSTTDDKQQENLENALRRGVVQCYALEGSYPPDIDYLTEHYGLIYDSDVFLVDYEYFGSNLLPEITVLRKKGTQMFP